MPDLAVHLLTTYIVNQKVRLHPFFVLLGAMFPDILGRTLVIAFPHNYVVSWISTLLHSSLLVFLAAYGVSLLFEENKRKEFFAALSVGALSHMLMDATQKHYQEAYYWSFPFSLKTFELPLLWPDDYVLTILPLFFLAVYVWWRGRRVGRA